MPIIIAVQPDTSLTMPNLVGISVTQATANLITAKITPDNGILPTGAFVNLGYFDKWPIYVTWINSLSVPPGVVISQSPAPGTTVLFNVKITLTASNFPMGVSNLYSAGGYA